MVITLGAFGIASVDKWLNKKDKKDTMEIEQENNQNTEIK
jgi:hypothetical protein